jgi:hypothetical protein
MTLIVLFGPPAVGKMSVGLEVQRKTGLRLFHNHMIIDPVLQLFPFGSQPFVNLVGEFRRRVFEEVAASGLPGMIFTYVWALDDPEDKTHIDGLVKVFADRGSPVYYIELEATQAERLARNETPLRLAEKRPKRDIDQSRRNLLDADRRHRLNTRGDFFYPDVHLKIENTHLTPEVVAQHIIEYCGLSVKPDQEKAG